MNAPGSGCGQPVAGTEGGGGGQGKEKPNVNCKVAARALSSSNLLSSMSCDTVLS